MAAVEQEKVGVVVIHGVGETYEGWIDSYLVPELERWAAYQTVDGLDRKGKGCELMIVARCNDARYIGIGLADDNDFAKFASIAAPDEPVITEFLTAADRLAHLDHVKRFVRGRIAKRSSHDWLAVLQAKDNNVPSAPAFTPMSEVYRVRDPESSDKTRTWQSFTRRCQLDQQEVTVSELFWADMSKIGYTSVSRSSAIAQLFLEAPFVLGGAFLAGCDKGIYGMIAWLVQASNWLMRWPLAGLNIPIFLVAGAAMLLSQFASFTWLPHTVAATLLVVMFGGAIAFRNFVHRKVGLADVSLASCVFSFLLLVILGIAVQTAPAGALIRPEVYVAIGVAMLLFAWTLWTITIVLAALLVCLAAVWQFVTRNRTPPLARPAAAISLNLLLGMVWKLILPVLGVLIINVLVPASKAPGAECRTDVAYFPRSDVFAPSECALWFAKSTLTQVAILNLGAVLSVALVTLLLVSVRGSMARLFQARALQNRLTLPRLIASPLIIVTLFAGALINASVYFFHIDSAFLTAMRAVLPDGSIASAGVSVVALICLFYILQRVIERTSSIVHIGRDLVDHQYGRDQRTLSRWLVPEPPISEDGHEGPAHALRRAVASPVAKLGNYLRMGRGDEAFMKFRRRQRIQRRLEALIDEVIAHLAVNRLVFLAHSQGTVILHDYLVNHDNLVRKSHQDAQSLYDVGRIDVVTVGSPLTHIYRHYFADYDRPTMEDKDRSPLIKRVKTWTNLWRIDDPIGQRVEVHPAIENIPLPRGGHMYYWKEDEVCQRLWTLILNPPEAAQPLVQRSAGISTGKSTADADVPNLPQAES